LTRQSKNSARLTRPARVLAKRILRRQAPVWWGNLRRRRPFSDDWGFDRGLPIDRFYLESFLAVFAEVIRGRVLEVAEPLYTRRFGGDRVTSSDVLDIDISNEAATIVADLAVPGSLPAGRFDCAIVTQTLQYVDDPVAAVSNLSQALAGGGTLLLVVPCMSRLDPEQRHVDRWRFTPLGLEDLVRRGCPDGELDVRGYGNVLASTAFLMGLAADELRPAELEDVDPDFPLVACARVRKPAA
jgi:SAM-dependent methyltransferase